MRKLTPGEFRAIGPDADTNPAPAGIAEKLQEVIDALANLGALGAELQGLVRKISLSQLVQEHKTNVQRSKRVADRRWLGDHELRLREVEKFMAGLREDEKKAAG